FGTEEADVRLVAVDVAVGNVRRHEPFDLVQELVVARCELAPPGEDPVDAIHLRAAERALDVGESVVEPEVAVLGEEEAAVTLVAGEIGTRRAVVTERARERGELVVRRRDHASLARRDRLPRVEAESSGAAESSGVLSGGAAAERARRILEDPEAAAARVVEHRLQLGAEAEEMDRDEPDGPLGHQLGDALRLH